MSEQPPQQTYRQRPPAHRVFLSSTSLDLEAYRTRVASLVENSFSQFAVVMNRFALRPTGGTYAPDATSVSLDELHGCDVYVLLLAWRYGNVPAEQTLSVTHQEYREARRLGLPCFAFLADDRTKKDFTLFPASVRDEDYEAQLLAFRAEVVAQQLVQTFVSVDDLVEKVTAALHYYLLHLPPDVPHDLPPRVPGFVGRGDELERLMGTLRQGQSVGLSALVAGLGGVGKSALAAEAMHRLAAEPATAFPGGMTWVRCDGRTGVEGLVWVYEQLLGAWGRRLSADELRGASTPEAEAEVRERALRDTLRPQTSVLVLLDNVEVDFPLSRAVDTLAALGVRLLVTARHRPNLPRLRLLPLDVLEESAAVQLFAERYTDRGGAWDAGRDAGATEVVVAALGRLPLATELAASRAALAQTGVGALTAELAEPRVLERLRDPLTGEAAVRYTFEKSLALLTPVQRLRFAALGLPDGPAWPRPVIEALLAAVPPSFAGNASDGMVAGGSVNADLDRLAALSLVTLVSSAAAGASGAGSGVVRVRMHPLLRDLAEAEWAAQPAPVRQTGLVGLANGVFAWAQAHKAADAQNHLVLEEDEALLVGTLRRAVGEHVELEQTYNMGFVLGDYMYSGSHLRFGIEVWALGVRSAREMGVRWKEGRALGGVATMADSMGEWEEARRVYEHALAIAREEGDWRNESALLHNPGILVKDSTGDWEQARHYFEQSLAIKRMRGDLIKQAATLNSLGLLASNRGNPNEARVYLDEALDLARTAGDKDSEGNTLGTLGTLARLERRWEDAQRLQGLALSIARQKGNRRLEGDVHLDLGELARDQGQRAEAQMEFEQALAIYEAIGAKAKAREVREHLAVLEAEGVATVEPVVAATMPKVKRWRWPWSR